jgi:hypothetical protein
MIAFVTIVSTMCPLTREEAANDWHPEREGGRLRAVEVPVRRCCTQVGCGSGPPL